MFLVLRKLHCVYKDKPTKLQNIETELFNQLWFQKSKKKEK